MYDVELMGVMVLACFVCFSGFKGKACFASCAYMDEVEHVELAVLRDTNSGC